MYLQKKNQKIGENIFLIGVLKVTDEKSRIRNRRMRIRIRSSEVRIRESGSGFVPKCLGHGTLPETFFAFRLYKQQEKEKFKLCKETDMLRGCNS